jgi:ubiquinone/menaquinone biosynthesis C-methylase UbiE
MNPARSNGAGTSRFNRREKEEMKMTVIEKHFVNSPAHALQVAHRARRLLDRIDINARRRYLDVGCGVGAAACEIAARCGLDVTGIDVDPGQIEAARAACPHLRFMVMDATKLQFHDAEFDIVATSMVTHHLPGWERAFSEMIRVLRPGGYLIYSDFMLPSWLAAVGRSIIPFVGFPSTKLIESLASSAGLTKVYRSRAGLRFDFIWLRNS